jgi:hypothetical protein
METKNAKKNAKIFECKICDFICSKKSNYNIHLLTSKHLSNKDGNIFKIKKCHTMTSSSSEFICICGRSYLSRSGLWKHKKICNYKENEETIEGNNTIEIISTMFQDQLKENKEIRDLLIEQNAKIMELTKEKSIINNTTTNHFNLNVFLNEKCKNALDIMEFISSLQLQLEDLENTGKLGYVQGITKIFVRGLKELDIYKRPIHCSDLKRETLYIKDKDVWEKDNEKMQMKKAIRRIADKNFKQLNSWVNENPESKNIDSKKHEEYMKIINKSTGGYTVEEDENNFNKIIKNVAKEVIIDI